MSDERVYRVEVDAPAERAWAALTAPTGVAGWYFGTWPRTTWETGAPIEYVDADGRVQITGTILAFDPPRSFSHRFLAVWSGSEPDDQGVLTWTVEPRDDGCAVTLVHTGGRGQETVDGSRTIVAALKSALEATPA